jgi:hypothetical protein
VGIGLAVPLLVLVVAAAAGAPPAAADGPLFRCRAAETVSAAHAAGRPSVPSEKNSSGDFAPPPFGAGPASGLSDAADRAGDVLTAARPDPRNIGNCFQWKKCLGETIGNMWVDSPEFCGPLGGKSWKAFDGSCLDLLDAPWEDDPRTYPKPPGPR